MRLLIWVTAAHLYRNGRCKLENVSICHVSMLVCDTFQKFDSTLKACRYWHI